MAKDKLQAAMDVFGEAYIAELGNQLKLAGKNASGNLLKSLDYQVKVTGFGTRYTLVIESAPYLQYVDEGRKPGKMPPVNPIKEWTRYKGIPIEAAWGIATNIKKFGIKPTNVIQKALDKVERGIKYDELEDGVSDWVSDEIDNALLGVSKNKNITIR